MIPLLRRLWNGVSAYAVKFGVVGLIGFGLDVLVFNLLRVGVFGHDHLAQSPLGAKVISVSVAIVFNWIGNRYWTFREHRRKNFVLELGEYVIVSLGGMAIAVGCLYVSHYVLGFTSLLADNLASNVIGLGLGTLFRFFLYRFWVYGHHRADGLANLARVEEAQRTLFEEPPATQAPTGPALPEPGTMNGPLPRGPLS
ncbi:GtrA family protein [Plantibacter cousiniae (nom. nud.)]|uniref:Flippase GtrA (Transmembrane translocase of bactoprenol-linked glucose) n=1 Tax=Plantibacter cousiniae (nom. nud.) TaxID=199709 RepID=A0ABY1LQV7_9MICO|nr:GtrA family protein [Plantibacter cousiniae]SKC74475.1 Putative flippase GtrA (transmembrane translocase of bactoprenol-linked glucose) [Plantibacter cousiniae]